MLGLAFGCVDKAAVTLKVQNILRWPFVPVGLVVAARIAALFGGLFGGVFGRVLILTRLTLAGLVALVARLIAALFPALIPALITRLVALALLRLLLITLGLAVAILAFLLLAALIDLALRLGQKPQVMLGMLLEILHRHAVIAKLRIARQLVVLVNDLLRRAADLALGTRAVENPVDDVPDTAVGGITTARLARPGFG